jgi:hypothetical protein
MAKKVHQILIRFDEKMYEKLVEISRSRHESIQKYIKYVLGKTINTNDITIEEQSLLKDTVKLISLELQSLLKDSVKVMSVDLFREIEKLISNFHTENKLENKNTTEEIKNLYDILNQIYQESN